MMKAGDTVIVRSNYTEGLSIGVVAHLAPSTILLEEEPKGMYHRRFRKEDVCLYTEEKWATLQGWLRRIQEHKEMVRVFQIALRDEFAAAEETSSESV